MALRTLGISAVAAALLTATDGSFVSLHRPGVTQACASAPSCDGTPESHAYAVSHLYAHKTMNEFVGMVLMHR
ncbi:hypothetical protein [Aromatoleum toluclasticum]|uniref:hypothetical protein n=1 Tax=Aromatoleum toluclasticum TaxID=92003 RepID=UPI00036152D6|nr:hypothetical protein [Aromatoleum toluclasticum]